MCKAAVSAGLTGSSAPKVGRGGKHVKNYSVHGCIDWMLWFFQFVCVRAGGGCRFGTEVTTSLFSQHMVPGLQSLGQKRYMS